jgi:hypothetical protein|tara:strand:- start:10974 stop:11354 length:381 start_codon:yes stop_codon:yes gene_type:complete
MADTVTISLALGAAITAPDTQYLMHGQSGEWKIKSASFLPTEATAASGSNLFTITLKQGSDAVTDALTSNAGSGFVANTSQAFTLASTGGAAAEFGSADELAVALAETGTAQMGGDVYVVFEKARV